MNAISAAARASVNAQRVADGLAPLPVSVSADAVAGELARRAAAREARTRAVMRGLVLDADVMAERGLTPMDARAMDAGAFYVPRGGDRSVHREETTRARAIAMRAPVVDYTANGHAITQTRKAPPLPDRASAVAVPAAVVGAGDVLTERLTTIVGTSRTFTVEECSTDPSSTTFDTVTQYLSNVRIGATLRKRLADKNGRNVAETDILPDGVSSIDDIRQDAYVRAAALWSDLSVRADVEDSGVRREPLGDLRERQMVTGYAVSRPMRCRKCDACVEAQTKAQAGFDKAMTAVAPLSRDWDGDTSAYESGRDKPAGRAVKGVREPAGRRSPIVGKWVKVRVDGSMACESPVYMDDAVTPRIAVSRSIESAIATALQRRGIDHNNASALPQSVSIDGDDDARDDVARIAPKSLALSGVSDGLASLVTAVTGAVLASGGTVTAAGGSNGAGTAGVSADAWRVLCALLGHADTKAGRLKVRQKLTDVRAGKLELSSILATIGETTLTV